MKLPTEPAGRERYWAELRAMDPQEVCQRAQIDHQNGCYRVRFLNETGIIDPEAEKVFAEGDSEKEADYSLLALLYLLRVQDIPLEKKWISEKGLRGGVLFFQGPHALPTEGLADRFGGDALGFLKAAAKIGGRSVNFGDAAAEFTVLPRIPLVCVLWLQDDEFPAQINYLFDASTSDQLPLDVILDMVNKVSNRLTV